MLFVLKNARLECAGFCEKQGVIIIKHSRSEWAIARFCNAATPSFGS